jgi:uncharacterized phage-like protein YoqJ
MDKDFPGIGSLGITGHRPPKLGGYDDFTNLSGGIKIQIELFFIEKNPHHIVSGMALGVDQWAVEVALRLGIKVLALLPCEGQESPWPQIAQAYYWNLLDRIKTAGGQVTYVTFGPYTTDCMHRRNREIVDQSSEILSVWDGTRGGTRDCIRLALAFGTPVTNLNPGTLKFEKLERI